MTINKHVGKQIRKRRLIMGLSQKAVGEAIGITFQQIQKYENGANALNSNRLYHFSKLLRVPIEFFFDGLNDQQFSPSTNLTIARNNAESNIGHNSSISDRESLEIMKAFKRIDDPLVRKRLADLVRAITED